jgi:hypothetical protein
MEIGIHERHFALQLAIIRAINLAHSPGAQGRKNFIGSQLFARSERHKCRDYNPSGYREDMFRSFKS